MLRYNVYILLCSDDTYYTGLAVDVDARVKKHNEGKGAKYTRGRLPVKMVYFVSGLSRSDALKLEKFIKKQERDKKVPVLKKFEQERNARAGEYSVVDFTHNAFIWKR